MTPTAAEPVPITWSARDPYVRKALTFVRRRGRVTAEELVLWDERNGRRLFDWDDAHAAVDRRRDQAREFMNRFRRQFDGMRVRAFIHIREEEGTDIQKDAYYSIEAIAANPDMRAQVIADVTKRMMRLAGELKMWKLPEHEQLDLFERLREAMNDRG